MRSRYSLPSYFILGDIDAPVVIPQFYDENTYLPYSHNPSMVLCSEFHEDHGCLVAFDWVSSKVDPEPYLVSRPRLREIVTPRNPVETRPPTVGIY